MSSTWSAFPIKSQALPADAGTYMDEMLSSQLPWIIVLFIAAWTVLMCLKVIGTEVEHKESLHQLRIDAANLQQENRRRLQQRIAAAQEQARELEARRQARKATERAMKAGQSGGRSTGESNRDRNRAAIADSSQFSFGTHAAAA